MTRAVALALILTALPAGARAGNTLGLLGVSTAGNLAARETVKELKSGDVSARGVLGSVASPSGATDLAIGVAQGAALELVPGGKLVKAGAGVAMGAGTAKARGRPFSLGRALAGTAGSIVGGTLLAPIPGGAIIGGIVGGIAAEETYGALRGPVVASVRQMAKGVRR